MYFKHKEFTRIDTLDIKDEEENITHLNNGIQPWFWINPCYRFSPGNIFSDLVLIVDSYLNIFGKPPKPNQKLGGHHQLNISNMIEHSKIPPR